jgi:hypothetical protein
MDDKDIRASISKLVEEEHRLRRGPVDDEERRRLAQVEQDLDRCWDLLRQRAALREAGADPNAAHERPASEVEGYLQ